MIKARYIGVDNEHLAKYKVMRLEAYDKRSERKNG